MYGLRLPSLFPLHLFFFFFNDTATTEIYTLSLHDALPISQSKVVTRESERPSGSDHSSRISQSRTPCFGRSEEHTSELQSHVNLVCRLLLEKKKKTIYYCCNLYVPTLYH